MADLPAASPQYRLTREAAPMLKRSASHALRSFVVWPPMPALSFQRCPSAALANRPPTSQAAAHSNGHAIRNARWPPQASSRKPHGLDHHKKSLQSVATVHHVIQRPFILHSCFPWHLNKTHSKCRNVNRGELTPFLTPFFSPEPLHPAIPQQLFSARPAPYSPQSRPPIHLPLGGPRKRHE